MASKLGGSNNGGVEPWGSTLRALDLGTAAELCLRGGAFKALVRIGAQRTAEQVDELIEPGLEIGPGFGLGFHPGVPEACGNSARWRRPGPCGATLDERPERRVTRRAMVPALPRARFDDGWLSLWFCHTSEFRIPFRVLPFADPSAACFARGSGAIPARPRCVSEGDPVTFWE